MYERKWNGLCFDGQDFDGQQPHRVNLEECMNSCTKDHECSSIAYHPGNYCLITSGGQQVSQWTKTTHMKYTCYAKTAGISYNCFWF